MKKMVLMAAGLALFTVFSGCVRDPQRPFLNGEQKLQLIDHGYVLDEAGEGYDIFICPGYGPVLEYGRDNIGEGIDDLARYGNGKRWKEMFKHSHDALKAGYKGCIGEFMIRDGLKSWRENLEHANKQVEVKTFGWWLAYPWAVSSSLLDNAGRTVFGSIGAGFCFAGGLVVVPAAYAVEPTVSAGWNAGVEGVGVTALGLGWNTAVTPLLSMTERVPAPNHVDGVWIRNVSQDVNKQLNPRTEEQIQDLVSWGKVLLAEAESDRTDMANNARLSTGDDLTGQIETIDKEIDALQDRIDQLKEQKAGLEQKLNDTNWQNRKQEIERAKTWLKAPPEEYRPLMEKVREGQWNRKVVEIYRCEINGLLKSDEALTDQQASIILDLLLDSAPE